MPRRAPAAALALAGVCLAGIGCSGGGSAATTRPPAGAAATPPASTPVPSRSAPIGGSRERTVWLCRPDAGFDPCRADRASTAVEPDGSLRREPAAPPSRNASRLDCFYVYPTVSQEPGANADLRVQEAEVRTAIAQASRFSQVCRVWAPMYRQRTVHDLFNLGDDLALSAANRIAFASVESAWFDYLAHDNDGRRVVLLGHSQGASMLIRLIRADIDPNPDVRRKIALAIVLGGNVTVPSGRLVGGSFAHLPLCSRPAEPGCVVAYSSFATPPPTGALFGRPGLGVSLLTGDTSTTGQVACVNPAALGGGAALLHPYLPTRQLPDPQVRTPWTSFPGRYRADCRSAAGATWLQVTFVGHGRNPLPQLADQLGPAWGLHVVDVNLALGDLVADVAAVAR